MAVEPVVRRRDDLPRVPGLDSPWEVEFKDGDHETVFLTDGEPSAEQLERFAEMARQSRERWRAAEEQSRGS